ARLRAAGYPDTLLNAYLGPGQAPATPGVLELTAIQALGLTPVTGPQLPLEDAVPAAARRPRAPRLQARARRPAGAHPHGRRGARLLAPGDARGVHPHPAGGPGVRRQPDARPVARRAVRA